MLYDRYRTGNSHLVYHSFDATIIDKLNRLNEDKFEKFIFAGASRAPEERYWMLRRLLLETPVQMWVDESRQSHEKHGGVFDPLALRKWLRSSVVSKISRADSRWLNQLRASRLAPAKVRRMLEDVFGEHSDSRKRRTLTGLKTGILPRKILKEEFPDRCRAPVFSLDYYQLLGRSNLVFNIHSAKSQDTVDNMKMFETTGMGACLLTDTGRNMGDLRKSLF